MKIRTVAGLALLFAVGCSSGSGGGGGNGNYNNNGIGPSSSGGSAASYCQAACSKVNQCDSSVDVQVCTADCQNDGAVSLSKLRAEYVSQVQSCFVATDCATILTGDALGDCETQVQAALTPTPTTTDFCEQAYEADVSCGKNASKGECLAAAKQFSDAALNAAKSCFSKSCNKIDDCVEAELGH